MKKSTLALVASTLFLSIFWSCSDDKENPADAELIAGNWEMVSFDYEGKSSVTMMGEKTETTFSGVAKDIDCIINITEAPNNLTVEGQYTVVLKQDYMGTELEYEVPVQPFSGGGTWEMNGNKLLVNQNGTISEVEIIKLDQNELILFSEETSSETVQDIIAEQTLKGNFVFKRK